MSAQKKLVRKNFREVCLKRDKLTCVMCGLKVNSFEEAEEILDVHHIFDRSLMVSGGFVLENGITLCAKDHELAEEFHRTGTAHPGYSPEDLYKKINSSWELANEASKKLK